MTDATRTTCPYCGVGCGLVMSSSRDGWAVGGDPEHPANRGRTCSKGAALPETIAAEADGSVRLLHPEVDGVRTGWNEALDAVAGRLLDTARRHGPESIAFYLSGQLLTEDYYVANKLLKGFIGSPHVDTNSRLCMASTVAGHKRAFGADVVPGCYEDLEIADLVVLVGSNLAWCHPVLAQRLRAARDRHGTRVVVIDPRRTATCDEADLHLGLRSATDVRLFNGLLAWLAEADAVDRVFVEAHVENFDDAVAAARADAPDITAVAEACGLEVNDVHTFYRWFAETPRTVTVFSQGVNQSAHGTDKVNAILNVHLATGRVGRLGASPFSVTGQPNAMGGREVGGLANQLAAHMDPNDPEDVDRVRRFWKAPVLKAGEGLKAVDLFRAIGDGRIKAVWIMGTNPAVSLPEADRVRAALAACPLVIVSDVASRTDTLRYAHIRLPAAAWGEKDGTVTNSERRVSRQRPFRMAPGEARPDWWIVSEAARRMGFGAAFRYRRPVDIFREHAALSGFENDGRRVFDIGAFARLRATDYETLEPFQWPRPVGSSGAASKRLFADGRFATPSGRARMVRVKSVAPAVRPDIRFPLIANTGRYRDQWHTMTRTGLSPRLSAHRPEPLLEISPRDALAHGLEEGGLARVRGSDGDMLARVSVTEDQPPGQIFLPMHWTDEAAARGLCARVVAGRIDPISGQPDSKYNPVRVEPWRPAWTAVLFSRVVPDLAEVPYWVRRRAGPCSIFDLAGDDPAQLDRLSAALASGTTAPLEYRDRSAGRIRRAWLDEGRLEACLFAELGRRPEIARDWLSRQFGETSLDGSARLVLLAGRAPREAPGSGRLVCSCHLVTLDAIEAAVRNGVATTTAEVGRYLKAGTGCGSCISEIREILRDVHIDAA